MPESCTGARWSRGTLTDRPGGAAWRVAVAADAVVRAVDAPGSHQSQGALVRAAPAAPVTAGTVGRFGPVPGVTAAAAARQLVILHADATSRARARCGVSHSALRVARGPYTDRPSQDAIGPARWAGVVFACDFRPPPPPPSSYAPTLPLIVSPVWLGTSLRGLPLIVDYTSIPTPSYSSRALTTWGRQPWVEATPQQTGLRPQWAHLAVIYGGPGAPGAGGGVVPPWEARPSRIVPTRYAYMIVHALHCVRLPDRTPLPWTALSLRCDASTWAWQMSLDLKGRDAAGLVTPEGNDPVRIEIGINGAVWVLLAEDWEEASNFGAATVTRVTGRSLSALLSGRYRRPRDYAETSARTMAQLAEQERPGTDWTISWEQTDANRWLADWAVPAGAWSYQQLSPIQAIARLAAAAGGLVCPARDSQEITLRPVYPILPWQANTSVWDIQIPTAALLGPLGRRYRWPTQADVVHVSGGDVGGIQALVSRSDGTGSGFAPDANDALITHVDGARALGGRLLAARAQPPGVARVTMAVDERADFPVAALGDLIRLNVDELQIAPCTSIDIAVGGDANGTRVRQTLGLGETSNEYQRLLGLLPQSPRILAQIASDHGDGTVSCVTASGGQLRVRGSGSAGAWVWVRWARVEGAAPTMPGYDLSV
ncbi:hypothetical protein [uncultured Thiodictyon sp.]|uniref:hypothetical protein n=1 Tax=uncultured Thiodictyon sp. TaxID=1846217 RepID=UPI0025E5AFC6|nr:hypothetical protein [uncultured Thiodictyon sp.]